MSAQAYMICGTPRSGSTLLCDLCAGSGVAGRPNSFYRRESMTHFAAEFGVPSPSGIDGPGFDRAYLEALLRDGKGGTPVLGIRMMWPSVVEASRRLDGLFPGFSSDAARFERAFGTLVYLMLSRDDKVAQAVSRLKAEQTGLWHRAADGSERERSAPPRPPVYDGDRIEHFLTEALAHEAEWRRWFGAEGISPVPLSYEALSADPRAGLANVLSAIGQDPERASSVEVKTARLADAESVAWAKRFRAEGRTQ